MKKTASFFLIILFMVSGSVIGQTQDHPGKKIFMNSKCQTCHTVESHEITSKAKKTTDLSNVGAIYRANFLEKFLVKEEKIGGKVHPQAFKGSHEELHQLSEWLQTLNTGQKTGDTKGKDDTIKAPKETRKTDTTGNKK
jgi:cytochrome c553